MNIIYMGTPDFAVMPLVKLIEAGHRILLVVTQPDKGRDRKNQLVPGAVSQKAQELGLQLLQPEKIKENSEFLKIISALSPDLIVVAAYGRILPKELLDTPKYGCINIHGSLLPKYRGAAPIQRSIINGDKFTGISIMYMDEGLDTGDVLAIKKIEIGDKTTPQLYRELSDLGAKLLVETLPAIENGSAQRMKQNDSEASYAPMIRKMDGWIDFKDSPQKINAHVRGFNPWPGAITKYKDMQLKVLEVEILKDLSDKLPGTIIKIGNEGIDVSAGGGVLRLKTIQAPGKKAMHVAEFLRGHKIEENTVLNNRKEE
jgi:methionyl-tRNA formyltransferase